MDKPKLEAAVIIISDTAYREPTTDKTGDILTNVFESEGQGQWTSNHREIVPDDVLAVQRAVAKYCDGDDSVNLLVTTGGTGFAIRDTTPEAITPMIHRHAPGLV